ncbi:isoprenoid biosynthesis protein ElbB [Aliidiomarina shirensis]|uniref:Glyoxalase n=1 Tax=Aliidiomarina shirensis TaxID=1048642 RepID=A0A432WWK5_9GAMM|nr:isoprenoid biosynthesis glyoxalase ElbB [Aliidiomarina shirensis]RUO38145.1 isoprenoid biosynthesis protein ElbB [Aliidiomarina shirensis]
MKKVAILLSGSGVYDGAEINEVVLTLLHIEKQGASYECFAPNISQLHHINHLNGEETPETRNVLQESARIVRGNVKPLDELNEADFDALILPGGFGVAKNFCNFALNGEDMSVNKEVLAICKAFAEANKPSGYLCIAPVLMPHVFGKGVKATVGNDKDVAEAINNMGGEHVECPVNDIVVDNTHKTASTPAYMLAQSVSEAESGIEKLVAHVLSVA